MSGETRFSLSIPRLGDGAAAWPRAGPRTEHPIGGAPHAGRAVIEDVRLTAGARPDPAGSGARRGAAARGQAMASTMALNVALGRIAFDARAGSGRKYPPISTGFP